MIISTEVNPLGMKNNLFLDTSYAIAISVIDDQYHQRASEWANRIERDNPTIVTTHAVLLEIGNFLAKPKFRHAAVLLLESIRHDKLIKIELLTTELYNKAFELFRSRNDKDWGMVDCISFVVMSSYEIEAALTTDEHFVQAGFRALLREESV